MNDISFKLQDCALIAIATGERAQNLRELRDRLKTCHPGCLYYHFWGGLLRPHFDDPEFQNDFAVWASRDLNDLKTSEQLSLIDPDIFDNIEELRKEIIELIEQRLYELEYIPWAKTGQEFHFTRSQIVVFDTGVVINEPEEFTERVLHMTLGSIFYHFIDSRRRTKESKNDFSVWLAGFGDKYKILIDDLDNIDPCFTTLNDLRREIHSVLKNYFKKNSN